MKSKLLIMFSMHVHTGRYLQNISPFKKLGDSHASSIQRQLTIHITYNCSTRNRTTGPIPTIKNNKIFSLKALNGITVMTLKVINVEDKFGASSGHPKMTSTVGIRIKN